MANTPQRIIIDSIVTACTSLFTTILHEKVSEKLLTDSAVPALCISELKTIFSDSNYKDFLESYEIKLIIILNEADDPIQALTEKQNEVIKALVAIPTSGSFKFVPKESSVSNAIDQYQFGSAISCVLSVTCSQVVSYNP